MGVEEHHEGGGGASDVVGLPVGDVAESFVACDAGGSRGGAEYGCGSRG